MPVSTPQKPATQQPRNDPFIVNLLPPHFKRKLNIPGLRHCRLQTSSVGVSSVWIEYLGGARTEKGQGWRKIRVVQDVEELGPELDVEILRNLPHRKVLVHRKIEVGQRRPDDAVTAGIAQEVRASAREFCKRHALRCNRRGRLGQRKTTGIDVTEENPSRITLVIVIDRVASQNSIRNRECVGAGILYTQR